MTKEDLIKNIKDCRQSLIDNADTTEIYKYWSDISIHCYPADDDRVPYINIDTDIFPEGFVNKYSND